MLLEWAPKLHLSMALDWILEWYRGYQRNTDMRTLTEEQIARFENMGHDSRVLKTQGPA